MHMSIIMHMSILYAWIHMHVGYFGGGPLLNSLALPRQQTSVLSAVRAFLTRARDCVRGHCL